MYIYIYIYTYTWYPPWYPPQSLLLYHVLQDKRKRQPLQHTKNNILYNNYWQSAHTHTHWKKYCIELALKCKKHRKTKKTSKYKTTDLIEAWPASKTCPWGVPFWYFFRGFLHFRSKHRKTKKTKKGNPVFWVNQIGSFPGLWRMVHDTGLGVDLQCLSPGVQFGQMLFGGLHVRIPVVPGIVFWMADLGTILTDIQVDFKKMGQEHLNKSCFTDLSCFFVNLNTLVMFVSRFGIYIANGPGVRWWRPLQAIQRLDTFDTAALVFCNQPVECLKILWFWRVGIQNTRSLVAILC